MLDLVWLIPALPLAGFLVLVLVGRRMGEPAAGWFATLVCAASFAVAVGVFFDMLAQPGDERAFTQELFSWMPAGQFEVSFGLLADQLSMTMVLFVTGIGALIHLYSIGYMHGDEKYSKFFLYLNLFVFSMLMLVLGDNLLVTFLGWEGVGLCSYFLIAFWHTRNSAAVAGKKAFVTNRVGDWGFMVAMFFAFQAVGSLRYVDLIEAAPELASTTIAAIAAFLFVGAVGKSAQLPLYFWLPDAMEGPTPVSALIHAATMVTAGVYLMTRINPILTSATEVATAVAIVGALTALFAATIAVAQNDIKRVLAYSTVSQLGFMFLAVGSGAYVAAVFHMVTHAFFKALLFLGSGSVIHGMNNEQDMRRMGMLRKLMPITAVTFIIGWLAIAGVPPFAGFWSKDEILLYTWHKSPVLWAIGIVAALLTAFYMTRQVIMVFFGDARWKDAKEAHEEAEHGHVREGHHGDPHESPWLMLTPLVVLAILSMIGGALNLPFGKNLHFLGNWLEPVVEEGEAHLPDNIAGLQITLAVIAALVAIAGIVLGYLVYERRRIKAVEPRLLANAYYYDDGVSALVGGPGRQAAEGVLWFDTNVVDGAVNGSAGIVRRGGERLRKLQTGLVRSYAVGIGVGAVVLLAWFVTRGIV
jgi:NADH-quinone oxidoreductase subunit L